MCRYTVQSTLPLLDNCDSTYYYNIPSFIGVNGVLNSSVILITSYTIIIIITDICHMCLFVKVVYISSVLLKGEFNICTSIYYYYSSKSHTMTTHNYDKDSE